MMTYTVYLVPDSRGRCRAYANALPDGQEAGALVLRIRGEDPPDLPRKSLTLRRLLAWSAGLNEQGYTLGQIEAIRCPGLCPHVFPTAGAIC